jgi:hypothetical protein
MTINFIYQFPGDQNPQMVITPYRRMEYSENSHGIFADRFIARSRDELTQYIATQVAKNPVPEEPK